MEFLLLFLWFAFYFLLAGLGVNLGYHRVLTHRSLALPKWLERLFVTLGLPAGTPVQWVGNHRFHHTHADTPDDPHSPIHGGFLHAHVGWYIGTRNPILCVLYGLGGPLRMLFDAWHRPRMNQQYNHLAADVAADRYYSWLSNPIPYMFAMLAHFIVPLWIAWLIAGEVGVMLQAFFLVVLYNLGDAIDSVAHIWGTSLRGESSQARNNFLLGFLTLGEGWHANHHLHPGCARHGTQAGQFDCIWEIIKLLERFNLASEVVDSPVLCSKQTRVNSESKE